MNGLDLWNSLTRWGWMWNNKKAHMKAVNFFQRIIRVVKLINLNAICCCHQLCFMLHGFILGKMFELHPNLQTTSLQCPDAPPFSIRERLEEISTALFPFHRHAYPCLWCYSEQVKFAVSQWNTNLNEFCENSVRIKVLTAQQRGIWVIVLLTFHLFIWQRRLLESWI